MKNFLFVICFIVLLPVLKAQPLAFPGAEGGGKYTSGGKGGKVLFVDNLNDKGEGSLRKAIEASGPRTIIFRISGNIVLNKPLHIKNNDLTIAGQTAPGDGICLVNFGIRLDADNVIIRFIRIRPGDKSGKETDAISGTGHKNIIIDHCSFSWSNDEVASFYDNTNFTMQWCIITESLYKSVHHKGEHGYGGIWGGLNASFHHNLISDHSSRNPRFCGSRYSGDPDMEKTDFTNNVIWNWGNNSVYGGEEGNYNIVNNYYKPGPATKKHVRNRILDLTQLFFDPEVTTDTLYAGSFYVKGNVVGKDKKATRNNWAVGVQVDKKFQELKECSRLKNPVQVTPLHTETAKKAYRKVLKNAGASFARDAADLRIIAEVKTGTETFGSSFQDGKNGIIDSQNDVGGWPELVSLPTPADHDQDGIPDVWETKNGLDPDTPDHQLYTLNPEYTNVEIYLNSLISKFMPVKSKKYKK